MEPTNETTGVGPRARRSRRDRGRVAAAAGLVVALVVGVLAALSLMGGGGAAAEGSAPSTGGSSGEDAAPGGSGAAPILSVVQEGGFVPSEFDFGRLPLAYVSADGVLISPGPQILIYPGPALPNIRQRTLTPTAVMTLRQLVAQAGLDERPPDYGQPPVADVPTTVFTYRDAEGRTFVHRVEALEFGDGLPPHQQQARAALSRLLGQLADPEGSFGADQVGADTTLVPDAFRVRASVVDPTAPTGPDAEDGLRPEPAPWPVSSVSLAQRADCTPVTGPDAETLRTALGSANQLTRWTQDGVTYAVDVRPVLPGEAVCR